MHKQRTLVGDKSCLHSRCFRVLVYQSSFAKGELSRLVVEAVAKLSSSGA
jgi:hypothetical protein